MKPAIVMPFHDPDGLMFPHLEVVTPHLRKVFDRAFLGVLSLTRDKQRDNVARLEADRFFGLIAIPAGEVGEQFHSLYSQVAAACPAEQILHLCFLDRLAFALETDYRNLFVSELLAVGSDDVPLLFQRSQTAWHTHPRNYREIEQLATRVGELLFGRSLDFTWCHLAVKAGRLAGILPRVTDPGLSMLAQILLGLIEDVQTRDVDWLAWEDPFISSREPEELRREREGSEQETCKRLSYVVPTLRILMESMDERP